MSEATRAAWGYIAPRPWLPPPRPLPATRFARGRDARNVHAPVIDARALPLPGRGALRAPAEARARRADSGDGRHRISRRRQDHAGEALSGDAGGPRHRRAGQRVRRGRHRRRAAARQHRQDRAARQRLPVLQFPLRPADGAAPHGGRPRARRHSAFRPRRDRDQRARRPEPDPDHLRDRPRARRRVLRRGGHHGDRGRATASRPSTNSPRRAGRSCSPTAS